MLADALLRTELCRTANCNDLENARRSVRIADKDEFLAALEIASANGIDFGNRKLGYFKHRPLLSGRQAFVLTTDSDREYRVSSFQFSMSTQRAF
jgi:hypothetical protein